MKCTIALLILSLLLIVRLSFSSSNCPCGDNPNDSDITSDIICNKINSYINGVDGKNVGQCQDVIIKTKKKPPTCKIKHWYDSSNDQSLLHSVENGYVLYRIYQPGYYAQNQCYSNALFCVYNVQCAPNQFLYYHYSTHDIENPQPTNQCLDMITMTRDSTPNYEHSTCGRVGINGNTYAHFGIDQSGYEAQRLKVRFRSNSKCTTSGYFLWVLCVDMTQHLSPGCNMDPFIPNRKKKSIIVTEEENSSKIKTVPLNGILKYDGFTLIVTRINEKSIEYNNVLSLTVISANKQKVVYKSLNISQTFLGEGKLYLTCGLGNTSNSCMAVYHMNGVPLSFRLNSREERKINKLLSILVPYFKQDGDYYRIHSSNDSINSEVTETRQYHSFFAESPKPQPPSGYERIMARRIAIDNLNSCNAIVRSVSNYYLKVEEKQKIIYRNNNNNNKG